ncbi:hypothetical protein BKG95_03465 [Rodentibacter pneumotropicus]|nr:hypothetical protein BKG95_03465 [Rodentibacter pneumotropicus]
MKNHLLKGFFKVRIGRNTYLDSRYAEHEIHQELSENCTVHFTPVLAGAKKGGLFQTIAGAVLVVVGAVFQQYYLVGAGIGMMVGGVAQMLTKTPNANNGNDRQDKQRSTSFSNISNMVAQGRAMALCYGRFRCGSLVLSQGIRTYDAESEAEKKPAERRDGAFVRRIMGRY